MKGGGVRIVDCAYIRPSCRCKNEVGQGIREEGGGDLRVVVSSKQASGGRVYSNIVDIKYVFLIFKFTHFRNAFLKCYAYHKI